MVKVGNICVGCYSYSMTIYNFYVVTKLTDKSITLEQVEKTQIGGDCFHPRVVPKIDYPNPYTAKCTPTGTKITRRLKAGKNFVGDESNYGIIYIDNPISADQMKTGFQEDHLD